MADAGENVTEIEPPKRLFVPSLTILVFAISLSSGVLSLFLPEIAETFFGSTDRTAIGLVSQTSTVNNTAEVIFAFIMSILVIRFKHKSLLTIGAMFVIISTVGSFLAPDFLSFQIFFAMEGAGSIMVSIIAITLIGDTFDLKRKARAVSWYATGMYMAGLIGIPILLAVANIFGWRSVFLLFVLPASLLGLILAYVSIPSKSHIEQMKNDKGIYFRSFKQVLLNKSAASCLIGTIVGASAVVALFVLTFYRQQFLVSRDWAVGIALINASLFMIGSLVGGRIVNRFGSKPVAVLFGLISGVLTMTFFNMPTLGLTLAFNFASVFAGALAIPAIICLVVDQVPESRGTMMSLQRLFTNIGAAIGTVTGGVLLALFSYKAVGVGFGILMIAQAVIFLFLVKQPTETPTRLLKRA
jgi:predicted MFS family arabinose efflux permease